MFNIKDKEKKLINLFLLICILIILNNCSWLCNTSLRDNSNQCGRQTRYSLKQGKTKLDAFVDYFSNGLTIVLKPIESKSIAAVQIWIKTDNQDSHSIFNGYPELIQKTLLFNNNKMSLQNLIDDMGGKITTENTLDYSLYDIEIETTYLPVISKMLSKVILNNEFSQSDNEKILDNTETFESIENNFFYKTVFMNDINVESAKSIDDLIKFYKNSYSPQNITIVIAGDININKVKDIIVRDWIKTDNTNLPIKLNNKKQISQTQSNSEIYFDQINSDTSVAFIGFKGDGFGTSQYSYIQLFDRAVQDTGLINDKIKRRIQQDFEILNKNYLNKSFWGIKLYSNEDNFDNFIDKLKSILAVLMTLKYNWIEEENFYKSQSLLVEDLYPKIYLADNIATHLGYYQTMAGNINYFTQYIDKIFEIQYQDLDQFIKSYFSFDKLILAVGIPQKNFSDIETERVQIDLESYINKIKEHQKFLESSINLRADRNNIFSYKTKNGIELFIQKRPDINSCFCGIGINGAFVTEPPVGYGITNLEEKIIVDELNNQLSKLSNSSIKIQGDVNQDYTNWMISVPFSITNGEYRNILSTFFETIIYPSFDPEYIELEKQNSINSLINHDSNYYDNINTFLSLAFSNHPYSRDLRGRVDTISRIGSNILNEFHKTLIEPSKIKISCVGDVEPLDIVRLIERDLWTIESKVSELPIFNINNTQITLPIIIQKTNTIPSIMIGFSGTKNNQQDALGMDIIKNYVERQLKIINGFKIINVNNFSGTLGGYFFIYAQPLDAQINQYDKIESSLYSLCSNGFNSKTLQDTINVMIGNKILYLQYPENRVQAILDRYLTNGLSNLDSDYINRIKSWNTQKIKDVACRYLLPEKVIKIVSVPDINNESN